MCNVAFGLFAISWPITRHFFFPIITWSVASECKIRICDVLFLLKLSIIVEPARCFDLEWDPAQGKYFSLYTQKFFLGLLLMLNMIMLYWFLMIVKLIVKLFSGKDVDDSRSDNEDSDDDSDDNSDENPQTW